MIVSTSGTSPVGALTSVPPGAGYWISALQPVSLPPRAGAPYNYGKLAFDDLPRSFNLLATGSVKTVQPFNVDVGLPPAPAFGLQPGMGFWVEKYQAPVGVLHQTYDNSSMKMTSSDAGGVAGVRGIAPDSPLSMILRKRAQTRLAVARPRAAAAVSRLGQAGVQARIIGSLARGSFRQTSDVDILVEDPGSSTETAIEEMVRGEMGDFPFDVVYAHRLPVRLRKHVAA